MPKGIRGYLTTNPFEVDIAQAGILDVRGENKYGRNYVYPRGSRCGELKGEHAEGSQGIPNLPPYELPGVFAGGRNIPHRETLSPPFRFCTYINI